MANLGAVVPSLERHHDVLAPTLAGHVGGSAVDGALTADTLADGVEQAMDAAGFQTAHIVGNSLGGYLALRLAGRGRARTVVALAPAGGWEPRLITCPLRIVWGTADKILRWPSGAVRFQRLLPEADWVELDGVGHCPQLDVPLETSQLILGFTAG